MTDRLTPGMLRDLADMDEFVHGPRNLSKYLREEAARREAEAKPDVMAEAHQTIRDYIEGKSAPAADDLVLDLRFKPGVSGCWPEEARFLIGQLCKERDKAADRIEALTARVRELEAALAIVKADPYFKELDAETQFAVENVPASEGGDRAKA